MTAEEVIDEVRKALDDYYEDSDASTLVDKLENTIMFYCEELHPQGCGESLLADVKPVNAKNVHITQEQINTALRTILKPDDRFKTVLIQLPLGFDCNKSVEEQLIESITKLIDNGTSKP